MEKGKEGLPPLPGLGAKSRAEVEELMASMASSVSEKREE
jgi:hypothetical protein